LARCPGGEDLVDKCRSEGARAFLAEVETGHADLMAQLVEALNDRPVPGCHGVSGGAIAEEIRHLRLSLQREPSSIARNRMLQLFISEHREILLAHWTDLGLPGVPRQQDSSAMPPGRAIVEEKLSENSRLHENESDETASPSSNDSPAKVLSQSEIKSTRSGIDIYKGVAVFNFDQTLATRHVGPLEDLGQAVESIFGGVERVDLLSAMMECLHKERVAVTIVSRNSLHVITKALQRSGLLQYVIPGFILGYERFQLDNDSKSSLVRDQILSPLELAEAELCFIDDDIGSVEDIRANCPKAARLLCPGKGLGRPECDLIMSWARNLTNKDYPLFDDDHATP